MRIAEIFRSLQGEGRLTGTESIFVRASGCNLRCRWCDTPYASWNPEGKDLSVEEILERIEALRLQEPDPRAASEHAGTGSHAVTGSNAAAGSHAALAWRAAAGGRVGHVVLTGGEPMLFAELLPLCAALKRRALHITIETSGTLDLPVECDLMSISPKLSNSIPSAAEHARWARRHAAGRDRPEVIRRLVRDYDYQLKFVIERPEDCREVEQFLARFPEIERERVMLMPEGVDAQKLARKATWLEPYCRSHCLTYCARRQIEWFGPGRGK